MIDGNKLNEIIISFILDFMAVFNEWHFYNQLC
jgi:hypothetical protein